MAKTKRKKSLAHSPHHKGKSPWHYHHPVLDDHAHNQWLLGVLFFILIAGLVVGTYLVKQNQADQSNASGCTSGATICRTEKAIYICKNGRYQFVKSCPGNYFCSQNGPTSAICKYSLPR